MSHGLWKKLFIAVAILLVASIALWGNSWHQLNITRSQLRATMSQVDTMQAQLDSLKNEQNWLPGDYERLREQINLRLGIKEDSMHFITPDDPAVAAVVQEAAGDYSEEMLWKGYAALFQWIMRNVEYSADSPLPLLPEIMNGELEWGEDFWRLPAETIRDKAGDCEDMSALLASMLLNYCQRRFPVWVFGVRTFNPVPKAHIAVAIPVQNNQLTIFDVAGRYYSPFPDLGGYGTQPIDMAIDHWLNHLEARFEEGMGNAEVYVAFSEDFYREFSDTKEFIDWMESGSS